MEEKKSNYDVWSEQWRARFLKMDIEELKRRLPELQDDGDNLHINHFGRQFFICKCDGIISALDEGTISNYEQLNIYTLFGYVQPLAHLKNEWVKFENLKDTAPFEKAFHQGIIQPFCRMFDGKSELLRQTFDHLGAIPQPHSDVGYEWKAFDCIPMRFLFWECDDEFPAQVNILFDSSATDFIHGESIVTIAAIAITKLAEAAGISLARGAMPIF